MAQQRLLVVEDDPGVRTTIVTCLELEGYDVDAASSTKEAIERLAAASYPIVISDIYIDDRTGLDVLEAARRKDPGCSVILMTARGTMETVMAATRGGAFDYIAKPFDLDRIIETVKRAEAAHGELEDEAEAEDLPESEMIGSSRRMVDIYKTVSQVAPTDATVLIEGETGTGKELIARMVHRFSARASQAFVPVDCASIAPSLLESELFGHTKGSFTGASDAKKGKFELADCGTLFLDEIGDMSLKTQAKVLRAVEERSFQPIGAPSAVRVDVRVITATNKNLQNEIAAGRFREDLFYRLNVIPFVVPPLRERREDIPVLARYFMRVFSAEHGRGPKEFSSEALDLLVDYSWPGNVRELRNEIERLVIMVQDGAIQARDLSLPNGTHAARASTLHEARAQYEREFIISKLKENNWNVSQTARLLGLERSYLYRKMKTYGIEK